MSKYHKILGINPGASPEEIKKAYRKKVFDLHPDRNNSIEAKEQFILLVQAYEYLIQNNIAANTNTWEPEPTEQEKRAQRTEENIKRRKEKNKKTIERVRAEWNVFNKSFSYKISKKMSFFSFVLFILLLSDKLFLPQNEKLLNVEDKIILYDDQPSAFVGFRDIIVNNKVKICNQWIEVKGKLYKKTKVGEGVLTYNSYIFNDVMKLQICDNKGCEKQYFDDDLNNIHNAVFLFVLMVFSCVFFMNSPSVPMYILTHAISKMIQVALFSYILFNNYGILHFFGFSKC